MPSEQSFQVGIIGNGLAGHLVARALLEIRPDCKIALFGSEKLQAVKGLPYSENNSANFILNTPASRISLDENNPYDFCDFLKLPERNRDWHFASRQSFGFYAKEKLCFLNEKLSNFGEAVAIERSGYKYLVSTNEVNIECQQILLATGNDFSTPWIGIIEEPWLFDFSYLKDGDEVVVVGTGLTMMDITSAVQKTGKNVKVTAVSSSGSLPLAHLEDQLNTIAFEKDNKERTDLLSLLKSIRKAINEAEIEGNDLRQVIDGLRPHTISLFAKLSVYDKRRFFTYLSGFWNRVRHRAPIEVAKLVSNLKERGLFTIQKGRIVQASQNYVKLTSGQIIKGDYVFYAGGPLANPFKSKHPLWSELRKEGWIQTHYSGIGLQVVNKFQLVGKSNEPVEGAFAMGNLLRGELLECTAIPELKIHAKEVAALIAKGF